LGRGGRLLAVRLFQWQWGRGEGSAFALGFSGAKRVKSSVNSHFQAIDTPSRQVILGCMATKTMRITLPGELSGYLARTVKGGRYQDASEVIREALRRMEAADLAAEIEQFDSAFAGGHERAETEADIQRVEAAVQAGCKR